MSAVMTSAYDSLSTRCKRARDAVRREKPPPRSPRAPCARTSGYYEVGQKRGRHVDLWFASRSRLGQRSALGTASPQGAECSNEAPIRASRESAACRRIGATPQGRPRQLSLAYEPEMAQDPARRSAAGFARDQVRAHRQHPRAAMERSPGLRSIFRCPSCRSARQPPRFPACRSDGSSDTTRILHTVAVTERLNSAPPPSQTAPLITPRAVATTRGGLFVSAMVGLRLARLRRTSDRAKRRLPLGRRKNDRQHRRYIQNCRHDEAEHPSIEAARSVADRRQGGQHGLIRCGITRQYRWTKRQLCRCRPNHDARIRCPTVVTSRKRH